MSPFEYAILFAAIGVILLAAELFLPSHAVLGILGTVAILISVACCFAISTRVGFLSLAGVVVAAPFVTMGMLKVWPNTFIGRRMTLAGVASSAATSPAPVTPDLQPGDLGTAVTALRPIGVCDFNGNRVEAVSDLGPLPPGTKVIVTALNNQRPVVREMT